MTLTKWAEKNTITVVLVLTNCISALGDSQGKPPCEIRMSVDITEKNNNPKLNYSDSDVFVYKDQLRWCVCNKNTCINKCCSEKNKLYSNESSGAITCIDNFDNYDTSSVIRKQINHLEVYTIFGMYCEGIKIHVSPAFDELDQIVIDDSGNVSVESLGLKLTPDKYCIDVFSTSEGMENELGIIACIAPEAVGEEQSALFAAGMIISMPFLLATFIAYALLPDRNLHMKALMFYVISLLLGYIFLVIIQLHNGAFDKVACSTLGYLCIFFFMLSFFWMNVICVDIWFTFSGLRGFSGSKSSERRRFYYYCGYAWGASLTHILILLGIDKLDKKTYEWYHPNIGDAQCYLKSGYPELLYFYFPMAVLITINITLFGLTAFKIRKVKKETKVLKKDENKRHDSYEKDKQKFNLYLKLLFAMGVNWSMEIISWAVDWQMGNVSHFVWYVTDFCNAAYGVFIFFIFVFKRSIWKLLKKRYYSFIGKPFTAHSIHTTNTRTTSVSATNGSMHEMSTNAVLTNNSE